MFPTLNIDFFHSISDKLEVRVVKRLDRPTPGSVGGSSSLHERSGEDSNKEGGGEGEDMNTSRGPGLKHGIDDDLFSTYESPVVAKKSKPDDSSTYSGSFC